MLLLLECVPYLLAFLIGISIGSFVNVLVYRIPRGLDFVKGRSFCPACQQTLGARDLIPLLSWAFLKGKCRYCGAKISIRYPLVELAGGLLALLSQWRFGWTAAGLTVFMASMTLLTVSLIDWDTREIPDGLNIALGILAILSVWSMPGPNIGARLMGLVCVSAPMCLINLIKPTSFGTGDVLLMVGAGFLLGWKNTLLAMFVALIIGGGYGAWLLLAKKAGGKDHFAFGPALATGICIALFFGNDIILWYLSLFML